MRLPLSWILEYADLPNVTGREVAEALTRIGLEVESVEPVGHEVKNVIVGEVLEIEELTGFKKPVRSCRVDVGETRLYGMVCGATNFVAGDRVPVALPGATLPGPNPDELFEVSARKTYGRTSEGMICSARELGISDEHSGILVLPGTPAIGADVVDLLGLRDEVLDIALTPDRGYAASVRGVAREVILAWRSADVAAAGEFRDPAEVNVPAGAATTASEEGGYPARIDDATACDRFVLRTVEGVDRSRGTPLWMQRRLSLAGTRPISLPVDVTNYVMLELGQPLHAFDRNKLDAEIVVRRARPGEKLETLDHVVRDLHPEDILITDASGPISLAGTMGGLRTEIDEDSRDLVIEAAHFSDTGTARMGRRHRLSSDSSYRFVRGVDPELPPRASARAAKLLAELGGGTVGGVTDAAESSASVTRGLPAAVRMETDLPAHVVGVDYAREDVISHLTSIGCHVDAGESVLEVTPPSWRPDLTDPHDLVEEVARIHGYEEIPSVLPAAPPGRGLTESQRLRRRVGRALAADGHLEVVNYPFVSERDWDALLLGNEDERRRALRVSNPLSESEPLLRTTLLPGLLRTLVRNTGRGFRNVSLYETGVAYRPRPDAPRYAPRLTVKRAPTGDELATVECALPDQPVAVATVFSGEREFSGWWGAGRATGWADAIQAAREAAHAAGVTLVVSAARYAPWHPGRCARLMIGDEVVGHAGELHPRVVQAYELPSRTCAMELDLTRIEVAGGGSVRAPRISAYPVATLDLALVVPDEVPAAAVESALRAGAGDLLESLRLFDLYAGAQVGEGRKSLAYALRFRAPDRTLTVEEATSARDAAVAEAGRRTGAVMRGN